MYKKLFLILIIVPFIGIYVASGQCTPDPNAINPGIYPDSATGLPHGYAGTLYETTITVVVPTDTVINGYTIPIESIGITSFTGFPAGFSYVPDTITGFWPGGSTGCVLITGTNDTIGTWPLVVNVMGYASGMSVPFTIDYYKIILDTALSVKENAANGFEVFQNSPNPFTGNTEISFTSDINAIYNVEVFNMIGKVIYTESIKASRGVNKFNYNASGLPQGFYFYRISNGIRTTTKRMIVASK